MCGEQDAATGQTDTDAAAAAALTVQAEVWRTEARQLAARAADAASEASRKHEERVAAEQAAFQAQLAADYATHAAAPAAAVIGSDEQTTSLESEDCADCLGSSAFGPLADSARNIGSEIGTAAVAYSGDRYARAILPGDAVAQSVDVFSAAAEVAQLP